MSALTEYVVTYDGEDFPIDTAVWRWADEQACQRFFGHGEDEWRDAITTSDTRPKAEPWARVFFVWMALARNGRVLKSIDELGDFNLNAADWMRPADPEGFAAAIAEYRATLEPELDPTTPSEGTPAT